ncbi:MAG TPA: alpha/beta hydrolase [Opitutus sp.]|nr:alpha/beta hydrolase [Opitutus sp.]
MNAHKLLLSCFLMSAAMAVASPEIIPLWANGAPGSEARRHEPEIARDYWVKNIHNPSITVFLPPKEKATGAGVVIFPGGGHSELVYKPEGVDPAKFLNSIGVAAFVVKYRLAREPGSPYTIERDSHADARRAMRVVRSRASEWGLDPKRIGVMGFSAGGEMVSFIVYGPMDGDPQAADPIDRLTCRPDFQVVVYPGGLGVPKQVPAGTPPALFIGSWEDMNHTRVILDLLDKFAAAGVPAEAHILARGRHGFNMGQRSKLKALRHIPDRIAEWLEDNAILDPSTAGRPEE